MADEEILWLKLRNIDTGGASWEAAVNSNGWFKATHPTHGEVQGDSYSEIEERARKATTIGRVKVSVPYERLAEKSRQGGWVTVRGTATGIHGSSGNVLLREGDKSYQERYPRRHFRPMSDEDRAEMLRLLEASDAADKAAKAIQGKYEFPKGLDEAVRDAVAKAKAGE